MRSLIDRSGVGDSTSCAILESSATPASWTPLVRWRDELAAKPASNMKLLTTGVALAELGPGFRFRTRLLLDDGASSTSSRDRDAGAAASAPGCRLTVVGDGDPSFGDPEALASMHFAEPDGSVTSLSRPEQLVDFWVERVRERGIGRVRELVVDARIFESDCYHPAWPTDGQAIRPYCAEVWGLNFHANEMRVLASAKDPGPLRASAISFVPDYPGILSQNKATVAAGKVKSTFMATRSAGRNDLVVAGRLPAGTSADVDLSVHDAPALFGRLLAARLELAGIRVDATRVAAPADPLPTGTAIGVVETPIDVVLTRANTDSSNLHAESLLKRFAAERILRAPDHAAAAPLGSWTAGTAIVRAQLASRIGAADAAPFVVSDGSGLSHDNRVTARGLAAWIASISSEPAIGPTFERSMARAGESGTVAKRFATIKGSPVEVRCKTGYILGVSCLSGIAIAPDGRRVAFSILGNNLSQGDRVARSRSLQESIVREIARHLESTGAGAKP